MSKQDVEMIEQSVRYYLCTLLTKTQLSNLKLSLYLVPIQGAPEGCVAQCVPPKHKLAPYQIAISPEELTLSHMAQVAAHECVHLEQFVSGRYQIKDGYHIWQGSLVDLASVPDNELPWEVEAH